MADRRTVDRPLGQHVKGEFSMRNVKISAGRVASGGAQDW